MKGLKKICIILCVVMMQLGIGYVVNAAEDSDEVVKEGVKIDSVNVGDMTEKEVKKAVKSHVKKKTNIKVQLRINKDKITTTLKDLGYKWENRELVEQVMEVGKQGNVIKRYKDSVDLKKNGKTFELKMGIDQKKMKAKLEELCKAFNVDAKNASLEATGHGFKIIAEKEGCEVDYETTVNQLVSYIEKQIVFYFEKDIRTLKELKDYLKLQKDISKSIYKAFGLDVPARPIKREMSYITKWTDELDFSDEFIIEACNRSAAHANTNSGKFSYADSILLKWSEKNVTSMADIEKLDKEHKEESQKIYSAKAKVAKKISRPKNVRAIESRNYNHQDFEKQLIMNRKEMVANISSKEK